MNKEQAIDFIELKLEDSVFKPYTKSLTELTRFTSPDIVDLYEKDLHGSLFGHDCSLSKLIEKIENNDSAVNILETIIYTMLSTKVRSIEDFLPFSKFKKEFEIVKDIEFQRDYDSMEIQDFSSCRTLSEKLSESFGNFPYYSLYSLDKIIGGYYKAYLFQKNFDYYSMHGKYATELKELENSFYETRGKYKSNIPALMGMYEYFMVELSQPELLEHVNSVLKNKFDTK